MNKAERLKELNKDLQKYKDIQDEIQRLESKSEPTFIELINAFSSNDNPKVLTHFNVSKSYEFILGGDGRSMTWSEMRNGNVLTIELSPSIYVSNENKQKLKEFAKLTSEKKIDNIEIIEKL